LNTTDGTNTTVSDELFASRFQFTQNARVVDFQVGACHYNNVPSTVNVGIYSDVSGVPGSLVGPIASQSVSTCGSEVTVAFPGNGIALQAGFYWLAVGCPSEFTLYSTSGAGTNITGYSAGSGSFPENFPGTNYSNSYAPQISADWVCP
jgi:hypothetical protein